MLKRSFTQHHVLCVMCMKLRRHILYLRHFHSHIFAAKIDDSIINMCISKRICAKNRNESTNTISSNFGNTSANCANNRIRLFESFVKLKKGSSRPITDHFSMNYVRRRPKTKQEEEIEGKRNIFALNLRGHRTERHATRSILSLLLLL